MAIWLPFASLSHISRKMLISTHFWGEFRTVPMTPRRDEVRFPEWILEIELPKVMLSRPILYTCFEAIIASQRHYIIQLSANRRLKRGVTQ